MNLEGRSNETFRKFSESKISSLRKGSNMFSSQSLVESFIIQKNLFVNSLNSNSRKNFYL